MAMVQGKGLGLGLVEQIRKAIEGFRSQIGAGRPGFLGGILPGVAGRGRTRRAPTRRAPTRRAPARRTPTSRATVTVTPTRPTRKIMVPGEKYDFSYRSKRVGIPGERYDFSY